MVDLDPIEMLVLHFPKLEVTLLVWVVEFPYFGFFIQ